MIIKICVKCKKQKLLSKFHKSKQNKGGFKRYCKECVKDYSQKYYQIHKIKHSEYMKKYWKTIIGSLRRRFYHMKQRCNNSEDKDYKYYGRRGIKCLFKTSQEFVDYVINELKINPHNLDIDRINNDGNYEPGNIRFVTHAENMKNMKKR